MKIYGKNPVLERLKADPKSINHIFVEIGNPEHHYVAMKARKHGIPVSVVPTTKMMKLSRSLNSQGLVMEVKGFEYADYDDLLEDVATSGLTFLFLDGITDPQNFGAILRSVACLGGIAVVIPTHGSVDVTDTVTRVACGGENYVKVAKVSNLNNAIEKAKSKGVWIAGGVVKDGDDIAKVKLPFPLGLVMGSEGKGIRDVTLTRLDLKLTVPMAQPRLSLNAAHATTLFCYEIKRQKDQQPRKK
ncbi:MAG: 23S rRNA (guanosine(2251)-2'-O)-methyltransferase RlmB [Candidatus Omnitrophica bacterium]|nr:23S rRNA (guanosine(2251)-2'-O)-methyltransferase RlmB [Candidatus Omnitrophota bacterium]